MDTSCTLGSKRKVSCYTWDTNICKDVTYRLNNKCKVSCYTWGMDTCKGVTYRLNNKCKVSCYTSDMDIGKDVNCKLDNKCTGIDRNGSTDRPPLGGRSNSDLDGLSQPRRQQRDHLAVAAASHTLG